MMQREDGNGSAEVELMMLRVVGELMPIVLGLGRGRGGMINCAVFIFLMLGGVDLLYTDRKEYLT